MKITKNRLQEIILEEMKALKENPMPTPEPKSAEREQEDPIQKRIEDIMSRMRRMLQTQLATIDDPNEVIPFIMSMLNILREFNPSDLTVSEIDRVLTLLRTQALPDAQRALKQEA